MKSPGFFKPRKRHTQRRKVANFNLIYFIFCDENPLKSPPWKHTWWSEHFGKIWKKKTKSPHYQEGKKKSFEIATFWVEKKQVLKLQIGGGFGQIPSFLLFKQVYEGRANPNPLTPKEDDRMDRHLNCHISVGTRDLRTLWSPPISLNQERHTHTKAQSS